VPLSIIIDDEKKRRFQSGVEPPHPRPLFRLEQLRCGIEGVLRSHLGKEALHPHFNGLLSAVRHFRFNTNASRPKRGHYPFSRQNKGKREHEEQKRAHGIT
jgi:hypothetical protein